MPMLHRRRAHPAVPRAVLGHTLHHLRGRVSHVCVGGVGWGLDLRVVGSCWCVTACVRVCDCMCDSVMVCDCMCDGV